MRTAYGNEEPTRSRTEYSAINAGAAVAAQVVSIVMGYATRVVFTHTLSMSYTGINGLFLDILGILSLSELGMDSAMSFSLYRPIAEGNIPMLQALMKLFRRLYLIVAAVVCAGGLTLVPFLDRIVGDASGIEHLTLIYLLYLGNSVVSYLMVCKRSIITAHQRQYILSLYSTVFSLIQAFAQIILLVTVKNFIAYLLTSVLCTVLCNLFIASRADHLYPFLREKCEYQLPDTEKSLIGRNIRALALHNFGAVLINHVDNLLLSLFTGISTVGIYSSYYMIISFIRQVLDKIFQAISASVGNLGASTDREELDPVFHTAFFIGQWIYGFAAICLYELMSPFIELSFGPQFRFENAIVFVLCLSFFLHGIRLSIGTFWYALGMFQLDQYKALAEALLNLILSIILGKRWGAFGIFAGTVLSELLIPTWVDPYMFFRHCLHKPVLPFFLRYTRYAAILGFTWWIVDILCSLVSGGPIWTLFLRLIICGFVGNGLLLAAHFRCREMRTVAHLALHLLKKIVQMRGRRKNIED